MIKHFFLSFHEQTIFFPQVAEQTIYFPKFAEQSFFSQKNHSPPPPPGIKWSAPNSYFVSILTYCANVFGCALLKYLLERLYKIQKRAIRTVFNVDFKASANLLFSKHNIFTLEKLLFFNRGVYMYKIMNNFALNYPYEIFSKCTNVDESLDLMTLF